MTQVPAGWFPDPAPQTPGLPSMVRYWDGQQWTEHVQPYGGQQYAGPQYDGPQYDGQPAPATQPYATGPYGTGPYGAGPRVQGGPPRAMTPDGVPLAGWWQRVGAYLLDSILVSIVASLVTLPVQMSAQSKMQDVLHRFQHQLDNNPNATPDFGSFVRDYLDALGPVLRWSAVITFALWLLYYGIFLRTKGATPGMMVVGLAVRLRETPGRLPWSAILIRVLVQQGIVLLALVSLPLYLALSWFPMLDGLWPLWSKKKQALHDIAARTNVIRTR